jgi:hypothetical protein
MSSPIGMEIYDPQGHRLSLTGSERAACKLHHEVALISTSFWHHPYLLQGKRTGGVPR